VERSDIGKDAAAALTRVEAGTARQRDKMGTLGAATAILRAGGDVSANRVYALEGTIRGVREHAIPREECRRRRDRFVEVRAASDGEIFGGSRILSETSAIR
jgi:hypothetical protein